MRNIILSSVAVTLCASGVLGQAINIDFGNASPTPGNAYGAAAGQAGAWNTYLGPTLSGLLNTSAAVTGASISGGSSGFLAGVNDPLTLGGDDDLLDDYIGIPYIETYTVNGLAAGTYNIYGYTWTFGPLSTGIDVNGQGMQTIGGVWPGSFSPGTYSLHTVTLGASQPLVIDVYSINGALGAIAGVQIVPVPTPGAAAVLGLGGLAALRRGRR